VGTDWQASRLVGLPLKRIRPADSDFDEWWAIDRGGTPVRWKLEGEDLIVTRLQADGTKTQAVDNGRWQTDEQGISTSGVWITWTGPPCGRREAARPTGCAPAGPGGGPNRREAACDTSRCKRGFVRGDPGLSVVTGRPVANTLVRRVRNSLILAALAFTVVMPLALALGLLAGLREGRATDRILSITGLAATSTPSSPPASS